MQAGASKADRRRRSRGDRKPSGATLGRRQLGGEPAIGVVQLLDGLGQHFMGPGEAEIAVAEICGGHLRRAATAGRGAVPAIMRLSLGGGHDDNIQNEN